MVALPLPSGSPDGGRTRASRGLPRPGPLVSRGRRRGCGERPRPPGRAGSPRGSAPRRGGSPRARRAARRRGRRARPRVRVEVDAALERPVRRLARLLAVLHRLDHPDHAPRRAHLGVLLDGRAIRRERLVPLLLLEERLALVEARLCRRAGGRLGRRAMRTAQPHEVARSRGAGATGRGGTAPELPRRASPRGRRPSSSREGRRRVLAAAVGVAR